MIRTAQRPLATGRISLATGVAAGIASLALGGFWLLHTNLLTVALALLTAFTYVAIYTPLKRLTPLATFIGAFPGRWGPCSAGPPLADASSGLRSPCSPFFSSGSFPISWPLPGCTGKTTPVPAFACCRCAAGWLVYGGRGPLLRRADDSRQPRSLRLGMAGSAYAGVATALGLFYLAYTIRFARILRARTETESRMLARDLLKVSVIYLPLLLTTLMLCAIAKR